MNALAIDETGKRYGMVTIVARGRRSLRMLATGERAQRWVVRCDCGRFFQTRGLHLRNGTTRSCGCRSNARHETTRRKDETGNRYGLLVVQRYHGPSHMGAIWECACDCGGTKLVAGGDLRRGHANHCGCQSDANWRASAQRRALPPGVADANRAIAMLRKQASVRGLSMSLSDDAVRQLMSQPCRYCGSDGINHGGLNGIDRLDNDRGYEIGNVVPCCKICNFAKRHHSVGDFVAWVQRAAAHLAVEGAP